MGVVHLLPLPGSPRSAAGIDAVCARASADAHALWAGGIRACIVENFGDAPFSRGGSDPAVIAAMTRCVLSCRAAAPGLRIGVNVLRNDARGALAIAAATGASFVRVNVHTGAMVTDQGVIEGRARETMLERRRLGAAHVVVAADVHVKHAAPLGPQSLEDAARDTWHRGLAGCLIVTGRGTGRPTAAADVDIVRAAVPAATVWIGSGVTPQTAASLRDRCHGAIVGTWLHRDGDTDAPIDVARVHAMVAAWTGPSEDRGADFVS